MLFAEFLKESENNAERKQDKRYTAPQGEEIYA